MFDKCLETLTTKLKDDFAYQKENFDYDCFIVDEVGDVIATNMPEFANTLLEMTLDDRFNHRVEVDYEMPKDDLSIHVRSFLDESLREDLKDELDDLFQDLFQELQESLEEDEE